MNCKPGDIAIVVPPSINAGGIVVVLRADDRGLHPASLLTWEAESLGGPLQTYDHGPCVEVCIPDAWLKPVSGLPLHDEIIDEVTA